MLLGKPTTYTLVNITEDLKNEQILFEVYVKIRASMLRIWGVR